MRRENCKETSCSSRGNQSVLRVNPIYRVNPSRIQDASLGIGLGLTRGVNPNPKGNPKG